MTAMVLAVMVSCTVKEAYDDGACRQDGQEITIEATLADGAGTKTVLKEDGKVYWLPGNAINVFFGKDEGKFVSTNEEASLTAAFSGSLLITSVVGMNEGGEDSACLWGLYPYSESASFDGHAVNTTLSANQTGVADSFADDTFITLAKNNSFSLAFYNVLAGFRFTVTRAGIKSVTFSGNNGEVLAGTLKIAFGGEDNRPVVQEVTEGQTAITLTPEGGEFEVGKLYYIVFVPTTFTKGFSVKMTTDESEGTFVYSQNREFARNTFLRKVDMDKGVEFKPFPYVDLGLSVLWATCNLGASVPEEYGNYYAWGEVEPKDEYGTATYIHVQDGSFSHILKYNTLASCGVVDNKTTLDFEDDAAHVALGGNWRMPSKLEQQELLDNCTVTKKTLNGVAGYQFTSTVEGYTDKSIFIPNAGFAGTGYQDLQTDGLIIWSNSLCVGDAISLTSAWDIFVSSTRSPFLNANSRDAGQSIRPVYQPEDAVILPENIYLGCSELTLKPSESVQLSPVINPHYATDKSVTWTSSNPGVATVDENGVVVASSRATGTATITAQTVNGKKSSCTVKVTGDYTNLSLGGSANCYVVPSTGKFSFRCLYKGNGSSLISPAPASAELVWEENGTTTAPAVGSIVNSVVFDNGYVYFHTVGKEGNALIAVKDSNGNIVWSWHIWVTDADLEANAKRTSGSTKYLMDRNLGAVSAATSFTTCTVDTFGFLYQWGRKDPFVMATATTAAFPSCFPQPSGIEYTVEYSVSHPMQYMRNSNRDWLDEPDKALWGSSKTAYDPCPKGWRVPTSSQAVINSLDYHYDLGVMDTYSRLYFPYAGCIGAYDTQYYCNASYNYMWLADYNSNGTNPVVYELTADSASGEYPIKNYANTGSAMSVRCIKE